MRFVDVTNDIAFRKIFGSENQKKSLISFLNAVINLPEGDRVVDVEIANPYQLPNLSDGKSTVVDVKARDARGNIFIVEMQVAEFEYFHKRILYYTSQSYVSQIGQGEDYQRLRPVYFIGIMKFQIGNNPNYFSRHKVLDVETAEHVIQDVQFNLIELPKFTKTPEALETNIDQWAYFLKNAVNLNIIPDNVQDEGLRMAYQEAERYNWTTPELEDYLRASLHKGDQKNIMSLAIKRAVAAAEVKANEALAAAELKAKEDVTAAELKAKEALAAAELKAEEAVAAVELKATEAVAAAELKAKTEKNLEFIRQGKAMGLSTADLSKLTGLSEDEIEKL